MAGIRVAGRLTGAAEGRPAASQLARLVVVACVVPLAGWLFWAFVLRLGPNDFHDYWLAGRLLIDGKSPYDTAAMAALARQEHLSFSLGGGYSYPLPFALAMVPFAALPFDVAVVCFNSLSLAAFGLTVAAWATVIHPGATAARWTLVALVAGAYPPIYGTVAMGQANLILFPLLAVGAALALDGAAAAGRPPARPFVGGLLLGLAAAVKLVPGALIVPLALGRKWATSSGLAVGATGAMAISAAIVPWAVSGSGGLASLLDPDGFYTNQSINGFVTRLVTATSRSLPLASGAFEPRPVMLAATALFGLVTLAVLWRSRAKMTSRRGLAYGLAFALVAATIGAPKTSFWNESILLVAVALVLAVEAPDLRPVARPGDWADRLDRLDVGLLAFWFGSALLWALVWAIEPGRGGAFSAAVNLAWSASLYGMLALWLLLARGLLRCGALEAEAPAGGTPAGGTLEGGTPAAGRAASQTEPASTIS
jgi:alpha-1,2-mannosyltransferase